MGVSNSEVTDKSGTSISCKCMNHVTMVITGLLNVATAESDSCHLALIIINVKAHCWVDHAKNISIDTLLLDADLLAIAKT